MRSIGEIRKIGANRVKQLQKVMVVKKVKEDLTGKMFGRWIVLSRAEDRVSKSGKVYDMWVCKCSCDREKIKVIYGDNLRDGKSLSCGCISKETRHENSLNKYEFTEECCIGYTNNNESFYLDSGDYELVKNHIWYIGKDGYVVTHNYEKETYGNQCLIRMHRLVMGIKDDNITIDHKNRKRNDNRKENLRIATPKQNAENISKQKKSTYSKFKGVCWHKKAKKWVSYIRIEGKRKHLGVFDTELEAAKAYEEAAKKYYGEFACVDPKEDGDLYVC